MAQNVTIAGASYSAVPSISVPKTGGGTASFVDTSDADATAEDIVKDKVAYVNGTRVVGTLEGGGGGQLYIFVADVPRSNTSAGTTSGGTFAAQKAYYGSTLVSGVTVNFYSWGDYILDYITGWDSGNTYPFTTVTRGQYTFTMPSESVECHLLYDD